MRVAAAPRQAVLEMVARAIEDADRRLHDLRQEQWGEGAVAAAALALSVAASVARPEFALPLFVGGAFVAARAVVAGWRRWDLVDRLLVDRDAYAIAEVRARGKREASMSNRRWLSLVIRSRVELGGNPRFVANAEGLSALAGELVDPQLALDPACAAACSRLLTDEFGSPLINDALPAEDVRSRLSQIRAGFYRLG
jgi:hypothetical protein